jgi:hypothetical protein
MVMAHVTNVLITKKRCKMKKIEMTIECPSCKGTGVYTGMAEGGGAAVVCSKCNGTGAYKYSYSYNEFTGRKKREDVKRVYLRGMGYKIGLGKINFDGIGEIDMDKEGVSYEEFLRGKMPTYIKKLGCPMLADQSACHEIKGFTKECDRLNGGWIGYIPECKYRDNKDKCWERFEKGVAKLSR